MLIKFSAKRLPDVGEEFVSRITYFPNSPDAIKPGTLLRVVGYAYEHGFLYVIAETVERSSMLMSGDRRPYVAGADVTAWGPEVCEMPEDVSHERDALKRQLSGVYSALRSVLP